MRASQEPAGLVLIVEDNRNISEMVGEYRLRLRWPGWLSPGGRKQL
jgi:hypothetical protein